MYHTEDTLRGAHRTPHCLVPLSSLAVTHSHGTDWLSQSLFPQDEFFLERMSADTSSQSQLHPVLSLSASVNTDQFSGKGTTHFK